MIRLAYVSTATGPMPPEALLGLLRECQRKNAGSGVTGLLLYGNGTFLQVLEGPAEAVDGLFRKIETDRRHRNVRLVFRQEDGARRFPDWKMGFRLIGPTGNAVHFDRPEFSASRFAGDAAATAAAIDHFSRPYWDPSVRRLEDEEDQLAYLETALSHLRGCLGIASLVLEQVAAASREGRLSAAEGELCALALETIRDG